MAISDWAVHLRPREKLLQLGPDALSDAELLAICLRTGVPGMSAIQLSQKLLDEFQGIGKLAAASCQSFCQTKGLGEAKYAQLQAALELSRRSLRDEMVKGSALRSPDAAASYLVSTLGHRQQEVFVTVFLDNQHRVIACEELFRGTIDSAQVYPREIVKRACHHNAAALLFAHNHPSGCCEPSSADISLTRQLKTFLEGIDVRVLDHLIIGGNRTCSLAEKGLL